MMPRLMALNHRWQRLDALVQLGFVSTAVICIAMVLLGTWIDRRIRDSWIQATGEVATLYLGSYLTPHVQDLKNGSALSAAAQTSINRLINEPPLFSRVDAIKIWDIHGALIFYTRGQFNPQRIEQDILIKLAGGGTHTTIERYSHGRSDPDTFFMEIYAPLYSTETGKIIGFGEFYRNGNEVYKQITNVSAGLWFIVLSIMSLMVLALFYLTRRSKIAIDIQKKVISESLRHAEHLSEHNDALRRDAEQARLDAIALNEAYLAEIGSEIHDGPVQVLALALLKVPGTSDRDPAGADLRHATELIRSSIAELRALSSGMILPELQGRPLEDLCSLAVEHHMDQTATSVTLSLGPLPGHVEEAVGICAYRVIREGLMNAFKHAAGRGQTVRVQGSGESIEIEICDAGAGAAMPGVLNGETKIGLRGMNARLRALGGSVSIGPRQGGGSCLTATIPITRNVRPTEDPRYSPGPERPTATAGSSGPQ